MTKVFLASLCDGVCERQKIFASKRGAFVWVLEETFTRWSAGELCKIIDCATDAIPPGGHGNDVGTASYYIVEMELEP